MAQILNQYEVLQFHPNTVNIIWNDNLRINSLTRTTNIVAELAPALANKLEKPSIQALKMLLSLLLLELSLSSP